MKNIWAVLAALAACMAAVEATGEVPPRVLTAEDYARAERLMPYNTESLIHHVVEKPEWLPDGSLRYRTRTAAGPQVVLVDPEQGTKSAAADESPPDASSSEAEGPSAARAPDGTREVFIREHNLWLRDVLTGREVPLTNDGVKDFGYATDNSARRHTDRAVVLWSPDSRRIATFRQDERGVGEMYLVKTDPRRPTLDAWKYATPRDEVIPTAHRVIIEIDTGRVVRLQMAPDLVRSASWLGLAHERTGELEAQWSRDGSLLAFISLSRDHKRAQLRVADASTGEVRTVIEEQMPTYYESAPTAGHALSGSIAGNWRLLDATNEVIWYSSRDGWGHLYLYDLASGKLKRQLTSGAWNVVSIPAVDEQKRALWLMAVGREKGRNPYYEHLYRVGLDGGRPVLLTPEDASHAVSVAPSSEYFVDSYSKPDVPPVAVLRDRRGRLVLPLESADISRLTASDWRPPVPIVVKARDGATDLHGLMFIPSNLDESRRYPIINAIYPGPQIGSTFGKVAAFATSHAAAGDAQSLAELGFVVVMIDGMGTPLRSRAFNEATYGNYGDATLPDQVAGMKQLAQRHPWIDIERAGIYGLSGGGYAAARALLLYPRFFKVGVAMAGNHDPSLYMDEFSEKYMGLFERAADGTTSYDGQDNLTIAKNLTGRLFIAHGTLDDNVSPEHTLLLADALMRAHKDFDMLMLPNQRHNVVAGETGRYLVRRYWDYFVRHLLGAEPPRELAMQPPST